MLAWAERQFDQGGRFHPDMCTAIGVVDRHARLAGAAVFTDFDGFDIQLTVVGRGAFSRSVCRAVSRYVFIQMNCQRMTVIMRESDTVLRKVCQRHGFRQEGVIRRRYGDQDGILMGMLRQECRWLKAHEKGPSHGQNTETAVAT